MIFWASIKDILESFKLFFSISDKTIKLWKVSERDKRAEGYNLKEDTGLLKDPSTINTLRVSNLTKS